MNVELFFPGRLAVEAFSDGMRVRTDQPVVKGGDGTAPSPFHLFVFSLATCAGYYVLSFLRERGLLSAGLGLRMTTVGAPSGVLAEVRIEIALPEGFPEKYRGAVERAAAQCLVKRQLEQPPRFVIESAPAAERASAA